MSGKLRQWQVEALQQFRHARSNDRTNLLWEATPGAGKTTAALVVCAEELRTRRSTRVLVVVPTAHLKLQWARAAVRFGMQLNWRLGSRASALTREFHGAVATYQQVASAPNSFAALAQGACVVLDEVHHAADGLSWGDSLRAALARAHFVLSLSGTPFRSDANPIPFVHYSPGGVSLPDYSYSYSRAVAEGVCRPTAFFTYGGEVAWEEDGDTRQVSFHDPLERQLSARRLRAALDTESGWIEPMLVDADRMLREVRSDVPSAGGLVVAADQTHARKLAALLKSVNGAPPAVVLSDDAEASRKLRDFSNSNAAWLVACNMVSEGVDIPRLRVGVYATTVRTKMYFRQFLGRVVRRTGECGALEVAYCYLPADPHLRAHAEEIEAEARHVLQNGRDSSADDRERAAREKSERRWVAVAGVNTGVEEVIVNGNQLSLWGGAGHARELRQVVDEEVKVRMSEPETISEVKAGLVGEIRRLVALYNKRSGMPHAHVHSKLNRAQGVRSQTACSEAQLRQRISLLERMLAGGA